MTAWIGTYPYLLTGLLLAGSSLLAVPVLSGPRRQPVAWSGLLFMPLSFSGVLFEPEYWSPQRVTAWPVGPEDLLFTLGCGVWAWLLSASASRSACRLTVHPRRMAARYALGLLGGLAVGTVCRLCGAGPMTATVIAIGVVGLVVSRATDRHWRQRVSGTVGFTAAHALVLKAVFLLNPDFALQWNAANLWGPWVWGLPLEEIVWAAACGAVWPDFADFVLGIRWTGGDEVRR